MLRRVALSVTLAPWCGCSGAGERLEDPARALAPAEPAEPPRPPPATPSEALAGWWRSDRLCLELFVNGDFELSLPAQVPKVQVMGAATIIPEGPDAFVLGLTVARIWRARYTSPCARVHELGRWAESEQALGVTFTPGASAKLKLRRTAEAQLELCGETCATLTRETPVLTGRWRRAGIQFPDRPEAPWSPGDLLELEFGGYGHVWAGHADARWGTAYGEAQARFAGPDRFTVEFTAANYADLPEGVIPSVFGESLGVASRRTWSARRLAGERLEVCGAQDRCATLERQFDAYHHEL